MNKFNNLYNIIVEGLKSGYSYGLLLKSEIEYRLPLSNEYAKNILMKELNVELTIHSLSNIKNHGLHNIFFTHAKTFNKLDLAILNILNDNSNDNLFECIF